MANEYSSISDVSEVHNSAHESYDEELGLLTCEVELMCPYTERHAVASDILKNRRPWPKTTSLAALVPLAWSIGIRGNNDKGSTTGQMCDPLTAILSVRYSTRRTVVFTEEVEGFAEAQKLDFRLFTWDDALPVLTQFGDVLKDTNGNPVFTSGSPLTEDEAPVRIRRGCNIVRTEMFQSPTQPDAVLDYPGCTNIQPVTSGLLRRTFAPETLLYNPPVLNYKYDSAGLTQLDVVKRFSYQPYGWNRHYVNYLGGFAQFINRTTGLVHKNYPPVDFSDLYPNTPPYSGP